MFSRLNCTECFMRDGERRKAEFVINGQSVCEKHLCTVIRERGQTQFAYTWSVPDGAPVLEPVIGHGVPQ